MSLQPLTENDLPALTAWRNDERTRRWARQTFPQPFENQKKMILEADFSTKAKDLPFAVWLNAEKRAIGTAGLNGIDWVNRNCWLGLAIGDKDWWGRGIAGEAGTLLFDYAFGELGLHKIITGVNSQNRRSLGATSKFFTLAGIQHEESFIDGQYFDSNIFEIFDRDWIKMRSNQ